MLGTAVAGYTLGFTMAFIPNVYLSVAGFAIARGPYIWSMADALFSPDRINKERTRRYLQKMGGWGY